VYPTKADFDSALPLVPVMPGALNPEMNGAQFLAKARECDAAAPEDET
jgi:hypothetical protein